MAERHDLGRQESLFEGLAPPRPNPWARPPDAPARDDDAERFEPERESVAESTGADALDAAAKARTDSPVEAAMSSGAVDGARADYPRALHGELVSPPETVVGEITIERRAAAEAGPSSLREDAGTLAEPTLDDVVSRMWEGLAIGLPAACPLCHGEVVPAVSGSLSGSCTSCGMTID